MDYGPETFVTKIDWEARQNNDYRSTLWTGDYLQVMLMSMGSGSKTDLEIHDTDHFIRIEEGQGVVETGMDRNNLDFRVTVSEGYAIMIPAGIWHTVGNLGSSKLKMYVVYAPPQFAHGTVIETEVRQDNIYNNYGVVVTKKPTTSIKSLYFQEGSLNVKKL